MEIASWLCFGTGSVAVAFGSAVMYNLIHMRNSSIMIGVKNYMSLEGKESSIQELSQTLKDGDSKYPVIVAGDVHCWDEEGKPLELDGVKSCYQRIVDQNNQKIGVNKLDFVIRDTKDRDIGVQVPWLNIFLENDLNDSLIHLTSKSTEDNRFINFYLPHGALMLGIGKIQKKGKRLLLIKEDSLPNSLFLVTNPTLGDDPRRLINEYSALPDLLSLVSYISVAAGFMLLGLGYYLRRSSRRRRRD